jgi:hypothetical protein
MTWTRWPFIVSGIYDGLLGLTFLFLSGAIFSWAGVQPPNHPGYVQFPALLLLTFAAMFFQIARDPVRYRSLMPYGMALKAAYCGTVFYYQLTWGVPFMWIPFAWADLAFLILFILAYRATPAQAPAG